MMVCLGVQGKLSKTLRGGILILDVFNKPYLSSFQELKEISYENGGFWAPEPYAVIRQNKYYKETGNTLEQYILITNEDCECFNVWNQVYSKESLSHKMVRVTRCNT